MSDSPIVGLCPSFHFTWLWFWEGFSAWDIVCVQGSECWMEFGRWLQLCYCLFQDLSLSFIPCFVTFFASIELRIRIKKRCCLRSIFQQLTLLQVAPIIPLKSITRMTLKNLMDIYVHNTWPPLNSSRTQLFEEVATNWYSLSRRTWAIVNPRDLSTIFYYLLYRID